MSSGIMARFGHWSALAALALLSAASGCDRIGNPFEVLGAKPPAPDEFQVITRKPLRMPPTVALPEPRPGAPSPLEPDPNRDAVVALMGTDTTPAAARPGQGELALLSAAEAESVNPEIRRTLDLEEEFGDPDAAYEPPLLWELIGVSDDTNEDVLDPAAEARRLQAEGIAATPIDPSDRPPEVVETERVEPTYPATDRRPSNTLLSGGEPAFE